MHAVGFPVRRVQRVGQPRSLLVEAPLVHVGDELLLTGGEVANQKVRSVVLGVRVGLSLLRNQSATGFGEPECLDILPAHGVPGLEVVQLQRTGLSSTAPLPPATGSPRATRRRSTPTGCRTAVLLILRVHVVGHPPGISRKLGIASPNHHMGFAPSHRFDEERVVHLPPAVGVGHPAAIRGQGRLAHRPPEGVVVHGHPLETLGSRVSRSLLSRGREGQEEKRAGQNSQHARVKPGRSHKNVSGTGTTLSWSSVGLSREMRMGWGGRSGQGGRVSWDSTPHQARMPWKRPGQTVIVI